MGENAAPAAGAAGEGDTVDEPHAEEREPDLSAQEALPASAEPTDYGSLARRATNLVISLILVLALLFFARDMVPGHVAKRLAGTVGLEEFAWLISSGGERKPGSAGDVVPVTGVANEGVTPGADLPRDIGQGAVAEGTPFDRAQEVAAGEPEQSFDVQFSGDGDLLDYDAWLALDRAATLLREQPELFALIAYRSDQPLDSVSSRELAKVRIAVVEQYLVTAGVDADRLRLDDAVALGAGVESEGSPGAAGRFLQISLSSGLAE